MKTRTLQIERKKTNEKNVQLSSATRQLILVALVERYNENVEGLDVWLRREAAQSFLDLLQRYDLEKLCFNMKRDSKLLNK